MPKKQKLDLSQLKVGDGDIPTPVLQNIVATFWLGVTGLNLRHIALKYGFLEFNPSTVAAGTMRIREPRTTALAFSSGNMVCTGAKNETEARLASRKYVRIFQSVGIPVCFKNFKIQNIVASVNVGFAIKLQNISEAFGPYSTYEADLFPGLIFRSINPKLVFLCFRSGKVVITGAKRREEIEYTWAQFYTNIISKFRDDTAETTSSSVYRNEIKRKRDVSGL